MAKTAKLKKFSGSKLEGQDINDLSLDESSALKVNNGVEIKEIISKEQTNNFLNRIKLKKKITTAQIIKGIKEGDSNMLGKAITLIESSLDGDITKAKEIVNELIPFSGKSQRIGITGVPGVGKSTFIESFGMYLVNQGKKVAVLAVDPSSSKHGGSLMGDKTRMEELSGRPDVFIRPSCTSGYLGGVNHATREAVILCEAAGYEVVLIETVGVGQSEILVHSMVDFFLLLSLAGAGDELQGIKKGIMEMADAIAITKADGDNVIHAKRAQQEKANALHYNYLHDPDWKIPVECISSVEKQGMDKIWEIICKHKEVMEEKGRFEIKRKNQMNDWLSETIMQSLKQKFYKDSSVSSSLNQLKALVLENKLTPINAAEELIDLFRNKKV